MFAFSWGRPLAKSAYYNSLWVLLQLNVFNIDEKTKMNKDLYYPDMLCYTVVWGIINLNIKVLLQDVTGQIF